MTPNSGGRLEPIVLIAVGGFAGANLRYLLSLVVPGPGGTLLANATGSLALGVLATGAVYADLVSRRGQLVLATGFLSSFTTYSTFAVETASAPPVPAAGNVLANYALGFAAVLAGRTFADRIRSDGRR